MTAAIGVLKMDGRPWLIFARTGTAVGLGNYTRNFRREEGPEARRHPRPPLLQIRTTFPGSIQCGNVWLAGEEEPTAAETAAPVVAVGAALLVQFGPAALAFWPCQGPVQTRRPG